MKENSKLKRIEEMKDLQHLITKTDKKKDEQQVKLHKKAYVIVRRGRGKNSRQKKKTKMNIRKGFIMLDKNKINKQKDE